MKKNLIVPFLAFVIVLFSCTSESEKTKNGVSKAIAEFVSPDSLGEVFFKDTISLATVEETIAEVDSLNSSLDSFIRTIPQSIAEAEARKEKAQLELENLKFEMLRETWENIIKTEDQTIASYQEMLADSKRSEELNTIKYNFSKKAKENAVDGIAYYVVKGVVNGSERMFFVSPGFVVLNTKK